MGPMWNGFRFRPLVAILDSFVDVIVHIHVHLSRLWLLITLLGCDRSPKNVACVFSWRCLSWDVVCVFLTDPLNRHVAQDASYFDLLQSVAAVGPFRANS